MVHAGTESLEKSDALKIGIMLTYIGKEAREIYEILPWTEPYDKMKFDKVVKAFREYCQPCKNILYEQRKFWSLKNKRNNAYSMRLKVRIDRCERGLARNSQN